MPVFRYDSAIMDKFPNTVGGVIVGEGLINAQIPDELVNLYLAEQDAVKTRIGNTPLSEIASLSAWRRVFSAFGVSPTKYRSAPESLLRRLTKKGNIPSINTLVDIGNLISIRYGVPIAVFDRQHANGIVTVHLSDGTERYQELGDKQIIHPEVGEVVFSDEAKMVIARRWCWRQSRESAATENTQQVVIVLEAQHEGGHETIKNAVDDILALLQKFAGGQYKHDILDSHSLSM